jgi:O-antigen/teichoic acid export membrane protein
MSLINKIISKINLSPTKEKVVRNVVWAVTGKVITLLGGLLVGIFVARYLGPEQYGLMSYVLSYVALFQVLASFGMDQIEIREESKTPKEKDKIIGTAFGLKLFFAVVTIGLIALTAWVFEADSFTKWMIILYSTSMIMNSFGVIRNYFTSLVWNEYIVKTEITRTFIGAGIKVVLLLLHAPLVWFIIATLFDTVLIAGGYLVSYRSKIDSVRKWRFDKETAKYLITQSFPLLLSGAAVVVYQKIDQVMLGNMLNKEVVGFYAIAGTFASIIGFIPTILSQTVTPILVHAYKTNLQEYTQKTKVFINVSTWIIIIICIFVSAISNPLIRYTYGTQYLAAIPLLQITIFKEIGYAMAQTSGIMIITENIQKIVALRNLLGCMICITLNLLLIPHYDVFGAAITSIVTAFATGWLSHAILPPYKHIFKLQTRSIIYGWKDLVHINSLLRH